MSQALGKREFVAGRGLQFLSNNPEGKFIGFKSTDVTGEEKLFVLWRNSVWPLERLVRFCGQMLGYLGTEVQIGPAWNVKDIKNDREFIVNEVDGRPVYGLYLCSDHIILATIVIWPFSFPRNVGELTGRKKVLPGP